MTDEGLHRTDTPGAQFAGAERAATRPTDTDLAEAEEWTFAKD